MELLPLCLICLLHGGAYSLLQQESNCDGLDKQARAWSLVRAYQANRSNFHLLEEHGCLDEQELHEIQEDPDDAAEYLGAETHSLALQQCFATKRPNMLFIGVPHSGSSTLAMFLNRHPEMSFGSRKEHSFWKAGKGSYFKNFAAYLREFHVPCRTKVVMDFPVRVFSQSDPAFRQFYGPWFGGVPLETPLGVPFLRRLRQRMGPDLKLIMMIRDPYYYLNSFHINGTEAFRKLGQTGTAGLPDAKLPMLRQVMLGEILRPWLRIYPRENFLFLKSEDFFADPQSSLDKIFSFTNVAPRRYSKQDLEQYSGRRRAAGKERITDAERHTFHQMQVLQRDRALLARLTGLTFPWDPLA